MHEFSRFEMLVGSEGLEKLKSAKVVVFGVGGVGSYVVEALVRSGIGALVLVDYDTICVTNINRQLPALQDTVGRSKVEVIKERVLSINPKCDVTTHNRLYDAESAEEILPETCDYVVDAIDMVTSKIDLIMRCREKGFKIICSMGTGNKMNPEFLRVTDIHKTKMCPLAKIMRQEMKARRVKKLKVVYSEEQPIKPVVPEGLTGVKPSTPGSTSFVPSSAGLMIASVVVRDILGME